MEDLSNIVLVPKTPNSYILSGQQERLVLQADDYRRSNFFGGTTFSRQDDRGRTVSSFFIDIVNEKIMSLLVALVQQISTDASQHTLFRAYVYYDKETDPFVVPGLFLLVTEIFRNGKEWFLRAEYRKECEDV